MATQRNRKVALPYPFPHLNQYGGRKLWCFYFSTSNFIPGDSLPHNLMLFCYMLQGKTMHRGKYTFSETYQSSPDTKSNSSIAVEETTVCAGPRNSKDSTASHLPHGASAFHGPRNGSKLTAESKFTLQL